MKDDLKPDELQDEDDLDDIEDGENLDVDSLEDMPKRMRRRDRLRKGAYLFPNLLTSAGMMAGFLSIIKSTEGNYLFAAWAVLFAAVFDGVDGKVARLTNTTSDFGVQYDSLADLISFGVAPGVLIHQFALQHAYSPGMGWAAAAIYTICGALRLARFNVGATGGGKDAWFVGLPIPAAAAMICATVLFFSEVGWVSESTTANYPNLLMLFTIVIAALMVSTIPYFAGKDLSLFKRHTFGTLLSLIILMALMIREPERALFFVGLIYVFAVPLVLRAMGKIRFIHHEKA